MHARVDGPQDGRVVMFANSLGTDLRVWDLMLPHLPEGLRIVRFDNRGHGLSDCPPAPYDVDMLVDDALAVADALNLSDVTFVGLSIGGLIGQGVAHRRPDLVRALVMMDTAARLGSVELWVERMDLVRRVGLEGMADAILERWFCAAMRADGAALAPWRNMLLRTPTEGYAGACAALAHADLTEDTRSLKLPVLALAGSEDQATPPDLVRATADLCNAVFHEIAGAGHLPCVERPQETAHLIAAFLKETEND